MTMKPAGNGQIIREQGNAAPGGSLMAFVEKHAKDFAMVLPKHLTPERMMRLALSAIRTNASLAQCSVPSFASSLMACSALGLEPNTAAGLAYLIPRKNHGVMECTMQVGYKGLLDLMFRSGYVSSAMATPVFEGDLFEYEKGLNPKLIHKPCGEDEPKKMTHVYTIVRWRDGGEPIWDVLTTRQVNKRRDRGGYSRSSMSPWDTDYVAMAQKTGIRAIAKWTPQSSERVGVAQAVAYEEASERGQYSAAVSALGEGVATGLVSMGQFPQDEPAEAEPVPLSETSGIA
jgi:recombination protein RecT